ncbi:universal stress protein [Natrialbaceae archaeon A-gly3]
MAPTHILVPLDGSPLADDALTHVLEVYECPVTVLNVVMPLDSRMSEGGVLETDESRLESAKDRADQLTETARQRAEEMGQTVETAVETGDPAEVILEYVDSSDVDHVVMGGHGGPQSGTLGRLLGTVATTVVSEAPVSVTIIR